jgi:peptidoglycan/xylan/chitin deacetylase (PgdA/CDA1 family)
VIRSQTILVLLFVVAVIVWGANPAVSEDAAGTPTVAPDETSIAALPVPTSTLAPTLVPTTEPTNAPEPTIEPTQEPTPQPTDEPVAERPPPPDTGQDRSLIVERGDSGRQEVALTFDAGEGAGYTTEILDLLAEYGIRGTFGVTGQWAEQNPDLMRRIVDEGHQIINHTYDHQSYTGVSPGTDPMDPEAFREQVETTEQIIEDVTGGYESRPYFRFPYGDYDTTALDMLGELGFSYTMWWSCDTWAWMGISQAEIVERCGPESEFGGPGAILLMHVAQEGDWNALEPLIEAYAAEGYDFVTLEQMIQP